MHSHLNARIDHLIEQCQSGELNAAWIWILSLVYEMELRTNERLAEDEEPLMFTFTKLPIMALSGRPTPVWVRDRDYVRLFWLSFHCSFDSLLALDFFWWKLIQW